MRNFFFISVVFALVCAVITTASDKSSPDVTTTKVNSSPDDTDKKDYGCPNVTTTSVCLDDCPKGFKLMPEGNYGIDKPDKGGCPKGTVESKRYPGCCIKE